MILESRGQSRRMFHDNRTRFERYQEEMDISDSRNVGVKHEGHSDAKKKKKKNPVKNEKCIPEQRWDRVTK